MKKCVLIFFSIVVMLVLAVPALADTGMPDNAQEDAQTAYTVEFTADSRLNRTAKTYIPDRERHNSRTQSVA